MHVLSIFIKFMFNDFASCRWEPQRIVCECSQSILNIIENYFMKFPPKYLIVYEQILHCRKWFHKNTVSSNLE